MIDKFDAQARTDAINLLNGGSEQLGSAITVDATVEIYLDVFAIEQGWKLVEVDTALPDQLLLIPDNQPFLNTIRSNNHVCSNINNHGNY